VAAAAWKARTSETVREWIAIALDANGAPTNPTQRLEVLLQEVRASMIYLPDPINTDRVTLPERLFGSALTGVRATGDCADFVGMFVSACANIGLKTAVVLQLSGQRDPHLIAAVQVGKRWLAVDPATQAFGIGQRLKADSEVWIPLPGAGIAGEPAIVDEAPEFIGVAGADLALGTLSADPMVPTATQSQSYTWIYVLIALAAGATLTYLVLKAVD
jgi:hypothetical protein